MYECLDVACFRFWWQEAGDWIVWNYCIGISQQGTLFHQSCTELSIFQVGGFIQSLHVYCKITTEHVTYDGPSKSNTFPGKNLVFCKRGWGWRGYFNVYDLRALPQEICYGRCRLRGIRWGRGKRDAFHWTCFCIETAESGQHRKAGNNSNKKKKNKPLVSFLCMFNALIYIHVYMLVLIFIFLHVYPLEKVLFLTMVMISLKCFHLS